MRSDTNNIYIFGYIKHAIFGCDSAQVTLACTLAPSQLECNAGMHVQVAGLELDSVHLRHALEAAEQQIERLKVRATLCFSFSVSAPLPFVLTQTINIGVL